MTSSIKVSSSDCDRDEQPELARLALKQTDVLPFPLLVIIAVAWTADELQISSTRVYFLLHEIVHE